MAHTGNIVIAEENRAIAAAEEDAPLTAGQTNLELGGASKRRNLKAERS
jgi:hypothetical protein